MNNQPNQVNSEYVINERTLSLEPIRFGEYTKVYEKNSEPVMIKKTPLKIIRQSCIRYLSTYDGRREASTKVLGINRKVPVNVDHWKGTYLFPTISHLKPECTWITLSHLKFLEKIDKKQTKVTFTDDQFITVPVSPLAVHNQIMMTKALYERANAATASIQTEKVTRPQHVVGVKENVISFFYTRNRE
ncbi:competence protein ComK [Domibacillus robiginosus]|uniref:competence protein ComK n=1 Tax=Domibacillus robiginosus TaxID=1071054 RepID=UPI00067B2483|nr:competence protein ComK [Domibacillus robiginosus]